MFKQAFSMMFYRKKQALIVILVIALVMFCCSAFLPYFQQFRIALFWSPWKNMVLFTASIMTLRSSILRSCGK